MVLANFLERAPSFLLSRLLLTMDFESSRRFLQTSRTLRWTAETISQDSYRITLALDGLLDNPLCPLPTFSNLRRFACGPGMFVCFGNKELRLTAFGVMGVQMPYLPPLPGRAWTRSGAFEYCVIDCPEKLNDMIIGIGASIEEYDLVIFAKMFNISLHSPNYTDSFTNLARTSDLPLFRKEYHGAPGDRNRAYRRVTHFALQDDTWVDSSGFAFIDKDVFVNPNLHTADLTSIIYGPTCSSTGKLIALTCYSGLAASTRDRHSLREHLMSMSSRTTTTEYRRLGTSEAIIHIEMRVRRVVKSEDADDLPAQDFIMIVHRSALHKLIQQFQAKVQWFKRDITGQRTAYTYGQRYVETKHTIGRVLLMDFNLSTVQETLRRRGGHKDPIRILGMFERSTEAQEDPDDILECRGYFKENIVNRLPYVLFVGGEEWSSLNIYDVFIDGPRLIIVVFDENYKRYIRIAFLG
ncbi:hypothetical protein BJ912DRAFT_982345 [Pholiota molesta]|nr:hypothetical protein BJ912DRAFT_982345 [Pholiota molesta]